MEIKRILGALALASTMAVAAAQPAPGNRPTLDPRSLTETQIEQTQRADALLRLAAIYKQQGDLQRLGWSLRRLLVLRPNSGELRVALAANYAQQGEKSKAYELLLNSQKQGFGFDLSKDDKFAAIADTKVWTYIVDNLKANLKPFGEGSVAFALPAGDQLFDSLAFDPKKKQFLAGSVREGKIYRVGKNGTLQEFIAPTAQNGLWSVYAMAAVPEDDVLYVASTASVYFKGFDKADFGKAGVFRFRLSDGKFLGKSLLLPGRDERTLSSIAAGRNGQVYAADGLRNEIYRLDDGELKLLMENPQLTSLRGLALDADGKNLYFADYSLGVFGIDLAGGKGFDLAYDPKTLVLGGIDGLYWYDHTLVAIESGMSPHRVMRLSLSQDGRKIVDAMPLDAGKPEFKLPTYGAIDGDGLYFIANSQKNLYDAYGTLKSGARPEAVKVFRSNLRFAWKAHAEPASRLSPMLPPPTSTPGKGAFGNVQGGSSVGS